MDLSRERFEISKTALKSRELFQTECRCDKKKAIFIAINQ